MMKTPAENTAITERRTTSEHNLDNNLWINASAKEINENVFAGFILKLFLIRNENDYKEIRLSDL